jgi:UDPglucose--hexose-1-phosphate uridylyltransferase
MTPPEIWALGRVDGKADTPGWRIRVVPNLYPALKPDLSPKGWRKGLRRGRPALGHHDVIIHSPRHDLVLADMDDRDVLELFRAYRRRHRELASLPYVRRVLVMHNHGKEAGASLEHPHSQVFALPFVPPSMRREAAATGHGSGGCFFRLLVREAGEDGRVVEEAGSWTCFAPYSPRFPYEFWFVGRKHESDFGAAEDEELWDLARLVPRVLRAMNRVLDNPPYNLVLFSAPSGKEGRECYHWHIRVFPRVTRPAGFELGTGIYINVVSPEKAASRLREGLRATT